MAPWPDATGTRTQLRRAMGLPLDPPVDVDAIAQVDAVWNARVNLPKHRGPFWISVASDISGGYRRSTGSESSGGRAALGKGSNWVKGHAFANNNDFARWR